MTYHTNITWDYSEPLSDEYVDCIAACMISNHKYYSGGKRKWTLQAFDILSNCDSVMWGLARFIDMCDGELCEEMVDAYFDVADLGECTANMKDAFVRIAQNIGVWREENYTSAGVVA